MKTRLKTVLVIACFASFYAVLTPLPHLCMESGADCVAVNELVWLTRMTVYSGDGQWGGSAREPVPPSALELLGDNASFIASMIVPPSAIIALVAYRDRSGRKAPA